MSNPIVSFRISVYHLARGLQIARNLEPDYKFTSQSQLIKDLYFDYLAKMSLGKKDNIPQHFIDEIETVIHMPKTKNTFKQILKTAQARQIKKIPKPEKSIKSSVEDFTPPNDWHE